MTHHTIESHVTVIGGGIAGVEAAWQLALRGVPVRLLEMRPHTMTPAHHTGALSELVCSNSLKSNDPDTAAGLLKWELREMCSLVIECADETAVPAGAALAVDRERFSALLESRLAAHPLIEIIRSEATAVPEGDVIVASGPLTSPALEAALLELIGDSRLSFYDAAAPIIDAESIDRSVVFAASRWGKGEGDDYLNAPMDREQYLRFIEALVGAARVQEKDFERMDLFQACQPVEEIARTGADALRYGPLKPVGLTDPNTGARPYAVVQLRTEQRENLAYNLVGFQTNLTHPEQQRVFRLIPGLENADFLRFGVMHRNTFVDAPRVLLPTLALRDLPRVSLAGQLTGTEGYSEAAASGLLAALNVIARRRGLEEAVPPADTAFGALLRHATDPETMPYQPMHVNFGIVPPLPERVKGKRERYAAYGARARASMTSWVTARADLFDPSAETGRS